MNKKFRIPSLLACLVFLLVIPQLTWASAPVTKTVYQNGLTITVPLTYSSCVDEVTSDHVTITGLNGRSLFGHVFVEFVVGTGRIIVHDYTVDTTQDLDLLVEYPPVSQWPSAGDPTNPNTREIHVDIQLQLIDYNGSYVPVGPGLDWDVFCNELPPPPPPPPGNQGCTPGYWKNHTWWANAPLNSVFVNSTLFRPASDTLLDALAYKGGSGTSGASLILLRAASAAYLNSLYTAYPDSTAEVKNKVNTALASNDRETMLLLATELDGFNNLGCPLGRTG